MKERIVRVNYLSEFKKTIGQMVNGEEGYANINAYNSKTNELDLDYLVYATYSKDRSMRVTKTDYGYELNI